VVRPPACARDVADLVSGQVPRDGQDRLPGRRPHRCAADQRDPPRQGRHRWRLGHRLRQYRYRGVQLISQHLAWGRTGSTPDRRCTELSMCATPFTCGPRRTTVRGRLFGWPLMSITGGGERGHHAGQPAEYGSYWRPVNIARIAADTAGSRHEGARSADEDEQASPEVAQSLVSRSRSRINRSASS